MKFEHWVRRRYGMLSRLSVRFCCAVLIVICASAQEATEQQTSGPTVRSNGPATKEKQPGAQSRSRDIPTSGFLKHFTIESFGYSAFSDLKFAPPVMLSNTPLAAHGLECPRCTLAPAMLRQGKPALAPFGAKASLHLAADHMELYSEFGGLNAWKPEGTLIEPNLRATSFNDAWILQGLIGAKLMIDRDRRFSIGTTGRYFSNTGEGKQHWNSVGGSATFRFGR